MYGNIYVQSKSNLYNLYKDLLNKDNDLYINFSICQKIYFEL